MSVKMLDDYPEFLVEYGLAFHINRTILNPLGFHLAFGVDPATRQFAILGIEDHRSRPDVLFSQADFTTGVGRIEAYLQCEGRSTMELRQKLLGFVRQDHPPKIKKT